MNLHIYAHLIFEKAAKNLQQRKDSLFKNVAERSGYLMQKAETRSMPVTLY
jgi:DNA gyrase inhibitor GyrI